LRERSVCGSGEESEAAQIVFGAAGGLQDTAEGLAGEGVAPVWSWMVVRRPSGWP